MAFLHKDYYGIVQEIQAADRENKLYASRQKLVVKHGSNIIRAAYGLGSNTMSYVDHWRDYHADDFIDWLRFEHPDQWAETMEMAFKDLTDMELVDKAFKESDREPATEDDDDDPVPAPKKKNGRRK